MPHKSSAIQHVVALLTVPCVPFLTMPMSVWWGVFVTLRTFLPNLFLILSSPVALVAAVISVFFFQVKLHRYSKWLHVPPPPFHISHISISHRYHPPSSSVLFHASVLPSFPIHVNISAIRYLCPCLVFQNRCSELPSVPMHVYICYSLPYRSVLHILLLYFPPAVLAAAVSACTHVREHAGCRVAAQRYFRWLRQPERAHVCALGGVCGAARRGKSPDEQLREYAITERLAESRRRECAPGMTCTVRFLRSSPVRDTYKGDRQYVRWRARMFEEGKQC